MNVKEKTERALPAIVSIASHDDASVEEVQKALDELFDKAQEVLSKRESRVKERADAAEKRKQENLAKAANP